MSNPCDTISEAFLCLEDRLRAYLRKRLPDDSHVDDLLQEVLLKALLSEHSGKKIGNLYGWFYAATRTTLADFYRAQKNHIPLDENTPEHTGEDQEKHQELAACLSPMIEQLPALYRNTLIALDLQGKPQRELAQDEGVSISAIKSRASRGRALLKQQLLDCCHVSLENGLVSDFYGKNRCG